MSQTLLDGFLKSGFQGSRFLRVWFLGVPVFRGHGFRGFVLRGPNFQVPGCRSLGFQSPFHCFRLYLTMYDFREMYCYITVLLLDKKPSQNNQKTKILRVCQRLSFKLQAEIVFSWIKHPCYHLQCQKNYAGVFLASLQWISSLVSILT